MPLEDIEIISADFPNPITSEGLGKIVVILDTDSNSRVFAFKAL
jgi:hypothetical protein